MRTITSILLLAAALLSPAPLRAQTPSSPAGHWEGSIAVPNQEVKIEVDLAKDSKGQFEGTFGNVAEHVKGIQLSSIVAEGSSVRFVLKANSGGGAFDGMLSADGKSMVGHFTTTEGGYAIPFSLTRTGDPRIAPPVKSTPIAKELEGTWQGTLDAGGKLVRIVLTMSNQPGGATGTIASPDAGGGALPVAMTQKASSLTVDVPSIGASFAGGLNAAGELAGTWTQGSGTLPLTFKRAPAGK
jgi:hypothetical protein